MSYTEVLAKKYLLPKRALVVDQTVASGRGIRKILLTHGMKADNVLVTDQYDEAVKLIEKFEPHLLVTDIKVGLNSGMDLVKLHNDKMLNRLEASSIILTSEHSRSEISDLAELQVDGILIRPYTLKTMQDCLASSLGLKLDPPEFLKKFEWGKLSLKAKNTPEALVHFEEAMKLDSSHPPLYAFYALACLETAQYEKAESLIAQGLKFDPKSYICLNALFDVYTMQKKYQLAYSTAEEMHQIYPPSSGRLLELVKLSIHCGKMEEILAYCETFKAIEAKTAQLSRIIIASLLICSRYFNQKGDAEKCKTTLSNAARVSLKSELLQPETLRYMIENKEFEMGNRFSTQLPESLQQRNDILNLRLELLYELEGLSDLINLGQSLIKNGGDTKRTYELMIQSSRKLNRSDQVIENLIAEASIRYSNIK